MRISLVDPSLFTLPYDRELSRALIRAGHSVRLYGRPLRRDETTAEIPDAWIPHFYRWSESPRSHGRRGRLLLKGLEHAAGMRALIRALRHWAPDIIHVQWFPLPVVDRAYLRGMRNLAPLVFTVHDTDPFHGSPTSRVQTWSWAALLAAADLLLVHSEFSAGQLERRGVPPSRIVRVPHGLLPVRGSTQTAAPGPSKPVVLYFGTIKPYKGVDVLLRAFAALPDRLRAQTSLRIAGRPLVPAAPLLKLADELRIRSSVAFDLRFIPEPEVAALLEAAAVIVLPYRQIDASGALMSILPAGRPVIVTATGGLPEVIADGVHGHVVPPGDPTALAGAITRILEDPDAGRRMAEAVRTLARALPDWAAIAAVTVGAYFRAQQMWDAGRAPRVAMPRSGVSSPPTKGSGP